MFILTVRDIEAALAAGAASREDSSCCAPVSKDFDEIQTTIRTRVEEALGIETLDRVECRDTFEINGTVRGLRHLRLANAFLTTDKPVFIDSEGEVVETSARIDRKYGILSVGLGEGTYTVQYTSGFTAEDANHVYKDLPDWVKSIALATYFLWRRSMNRGAAPKDISHKGLLDGMVRELNARIYNRYDRPRQGMYFHLTHERRPVGSTGEWNAW